MAGGTRGPDIPDSEARQVFDQLTDSVAILDRDWRIVYANPTLIERTGQPIGDLVGRTVWEIWPQAAGSEIERQYRKALESNTAVHFEHNYVAPGWDVWTEIGVYPCGSGLAVHSRDITARKRMEQALRESEERYRATFNAAPVGIAHVALDGRWLRFNDAVCGITGYSREELETKTFADITHPDDVEGDWARARQLIAGGIPGYQMEKRYIRGDGSIVWVNLTVSMLRTAAGAPQHFVSVIQDVSARRTAEAAVREREERLGAVLENIKDSFVALDREWRFLYVNSAWEKMTGIPRELVIGQSVEDVSPTVLDPDVRAGFERAVSQQTTVEFEIRQAAGDRWIEHRVYPASDGGISCYCRDVTDAKRTREALRESEERYRSLVVATSAIVWTASPSGEFTVPQPAWQQYTGQTWEEYRGGNWIDAVHPDDRARISLSWRRAVENRSTYEVEWRAWHAASREWRYCFTRATPVYGAHGEIREWIGAVTDIHDRKQLDSKLQHEDKVESLGVLAAGVAHDFNNLLVGIMGSASLAAEDASPLSKPLIDEVVRAAQRASALTRQMLAYAGKGRLAVESVNLSDEVRDVVHLVRSSLGPAAHVEMDLAEGLPTIRADRGQIQQIVMNLVINAGEALPREGGTIRVATSRDPSQPDAVALSVEDNGHGMTEDVQARIFDPFFTTKYTGRGLGLAAVLGVVRAHGGSIEVDSRPGRGTIFRVSLPASAAPSREETENESREDEFSAGPTTVLVIDDEPVVLNVARFALEKAGMKPILAGGGVDGIRIFLENPETIDVVILDATMPDLGGRDVLRAIRERRPDVCVIISSGHATAELERYFGADMPSALLLKPYKPAALVAAVAAQATVRQTARSSG